MSARSLRRYRVTVVERREFIMIIDGKNSREARSLVLEIYNRRHFTDTSTPDDRQIRVAHVEEMIEHGGVP